jgi:hypothetical protein
VALALFLTVPTEEIQRQDVRNAKVKPDGAVLGNFVKVSGSAVILPARRA